VKNIDLNDLVRETVEFLSALAIARKVELVSVITPDALPILGDRIQLQQVILNLVVNGIDAVKDTSTENRIISIRTSRVETFAELSVSDRGPGIPEDKLKEVFEPFYTSKVQGMGMGLSIARTIIEAHHGLIYAKNRDHGGASFRIRLPPLYRRRWAVIVADRRALVNHKNEGIADAKARGVYKGRKASIDTAKIKQMKAAGIGPSAIAKTLKIGRASVYRVLTS
jgi:hypothetical protein